MTNHNQQSKRGQILQIPYWERYLLTIREAAEYFNIGEKKLRRLAEEHTGDFAVINGNRYLIIILFL